MFEDQSQPRILNTDQRLRDLREYKNNKSQDQFSQIEKKKMKLNDKKKIINQKKSSSID